MMQELLRTKFGDCKFAEVSDCKGSYEDISAEDFYIYDPLPEDKQPVRIVTVSENHQLKIKNTYKTEVCLVKTDKCLFPDDISKCDCLLFNHSKFFFVEIKSSSTGTRKDKRRDAVLQLGTTIEILINNGIDLSNFDAKAIICFKNENERPIQASRNSRRAEFLEKYRVSLDEGNKISF